MVITGVMGVPCETMREVLKTFKGVEHRIETVRELDGVTWINDSKGTNVDSTQKAIATMKKPTVLILGGSAGPEHRGSAADRALRAHRRHGEPD